MILEELSYHDVEIRLRVVPRVIASPKINDQFKFSEQVSIWTKTVMIASEAIFAGFIALAQNAYFLVTSRIWLIFMIFILMLHHSSNRAVFRFYIFISAVLKKYYLRTTLLVNYQFFYCSFFLSILLTVALYHESKPFAYSSYYLIISNARQKTDDFVLIWALES